MTTITGTLLVGGGSTPTAAGQVCWMRVALTQGVFLPGGAQLADSFVKISVDQDTGNWSTDVAPLVTGWAYQFDTITDGGGSVDTRIVTVPDSGTAAFSTLPDFSGSAGDPTYITPAQVVVATTAAAAAASSATAAAASAAGISPGTPSGVATLDTDGKLTPAQTPTVLTQAALDARYDLAGSVTKTSLGVANVDNTSDVSKPVSTAQAAADAAVLAAADKLRTIAAQLSNDATLVANKITPVTAAANSCSMTLPTGTVNAEIAVIKTDSSSNLVNLTGNIRGVAATISLGSLNESVVLRSDATGVWWPYASTSTVSKASLDSTYVTLGGTTVPVDISHPLIEFDNGSDEAVLHIVALPGGAAPYMIGMGVNADGAKGIVVDITNSGATGLQVNLFNTDAASTTAASFQANDGSEGDLVRIDTFGHTGVAERVHAQGTPATDQRLIVWTTDALAGTGSSFGSDILSVYSDDGLIDFTGPVARKNGGKLVVTESDSTGTGNFSKTEMAASAVTQRQYTGSTGIFWSHQALTSGTEVQYQSASAAAPGSESWQTVLRMNSTGIGFYNHAPVAQPTRAVTLADVIAVLAGNGLTA